MATTWRPSSGFSVGVKEMPLGCGTGGLSARPTLQVRRGPRRAQHLRRRSRRMERPDRGAATAFARVGHAAELRLPGRHNRINAACAAAAALGAGCDGARSTKGWPVSAACRSGWNCLPLSRVAASSTTRPPRRPNRPWPRLDALQGRIWLLAGGADKGCDFTPLVTAIARRVCGVALSARWGSDCAAGLPRRISSYPARPADDGAGLAVVLAMFAAGRSCAPFAGLFQPRSVPQFSRARRAVCGDGCARWFVSPGGSRRSREGRVLYYGSNQNRRRRMVLFSLAQAFHAWEKVAIIKFSFSSGPVHGAVVSGDSRLKAAKRKTKDGLAAWSQA